MDNLANCVEIMIIKKLMSAMVICMILFGKEIVLLFSFRPYQAKEVYIAGTFKKWMKKFKMEKEKN